MKRHFRDIYHAESRNHEGQFSLEFCYGNEEEKITLHFPRWWLGELAQMLWKVLNAEEEEVARLRERMKANAP